VQGRDESGARLHHHTRKELLMRSAFHLLRMLGCSAAVAMFSVALTGCMTSDAKPTAAKSADKCEDCCKEDAKDGKAVVVNKGKETVATPTTQPSK
jgi:hypothetical protein